jgi:spore germination protein GerM
MVESAPNCDLAPAEPSEGTVLVYLVKQNFRIPRRDEFVPVARRMTRNQAQTPLRAALLELLAGPTRAETRLGCTSVFSQRSTGLLKDVAIVDRQAVVDLHDLAGKLPGGTTADTLFATQMNLTVFQFPAVQSVRYQMNGSCESFFNRLQGNCQIFRR